MDLSDTGTQVQGPQVYLTLIKMKIKHSTKQQNNEKQPRRVQETQKELKKMRSVTIFALVMN